MPHYLTLYADAAGTIIKAREALKEQFPEEIVNYDDPPGNNKDLNQPPGSPTYALTLIFKAAGKETSDHVKATTEAMADYLRSEAVGLNVVHYRDNERAWAGGINFAAKFIIG